MSVEKICSLAELRSEKNHVNSLGISQESRQRISEWLDSCWKVAQTLPGGFIRKLTWDHESGHPEHAWGFVQYSPRPYRPGYGCDGTTDENIHLIAATLCNQVGIDYADAYFSAYAGEKHSIEDLRNWIGQLASDATLVSETIFPAADAEGLKLMLADLYQINNRSLVTELEARLHAIRQFAELQVVV